MKTEGVPFDGHHIFWSFSYNPENYLKESELSGDEIRKGGYIRIFRNNSCVLRRFCREAHIAAAMMYSLLLECQDISWDLVVEGAKVYFWSTPAVIKSVLESGDIILETEDGADFPLWGYEQEDIKEGEEPNDDWTNTMKCHATDPGIYWWRK